MSASRTQRTIAKRLGYSAQVIENTLASPEVLALVTPFGYPEAKMQAGRALLETARAAMPARAAGARGQQSATKTKATMEEAARTAHAQLAAVARALLSDTPDRLVALGLAGQETPAADDAFTAAAYTLFDGVTRNPDIKAVLAEASYTDAKLQAERAKIAAFEQADRAQKTKAGAAHRATGLRDDALNALEAWIGRYVKIARVALVGRRDLQDALGISVARPSRKKADAPALPAA